MLDMEKRIETQYAKTLVKVLLDSLQGHEAEQVTLADIKPVLERLGSLNPNLVLHGTVNGEIHPEEQEATPAQEDDEFRPQTRPRLGDDIDDRVVKLIQNWTKPLDIQRKLKMSAPSWHIIKNRLLEQGRIEHNESQGRNRRYRTKRT